MSVVDSDVVETFFEHHGIKGMRWGHRKAVGLAKSAQVTKARNVATDKAKSIAGDKGRSRYQKPPKRLTDAELKRRINRMDLEKRYNELNKRDVSPGEEMATKIIKNVGTTTLTTVATTLATGVLLFGAKKALKKKFGEATVEQIFPSKKKK